MNGARVLPFRRRQFVARRRRSNPWLAMLRALAVSSLLVGAPLGAVLWVWQGPQFRLREVELEGHQRVPDAWVHAQIAPFLDRPLVPLRLAKVAERLRRHPWIGEVELEKRLPDGLRVAVAEHLPAAVHRGEDGRLTYVDADGLFIAPFAPGLGPVDLPLVAGSDRPFDIAAAVRLSRELAAAAPGWGERISEIHVLGAEDFRIHTADHRFPILLSADRLDSGLEALRRHRERLQRAFPQVAHVDLRFERQIILHPDGNR